MKYTCERCGYNTIYLGDFRKHLNRKNICESKFSSVSTKELLQKIKKITKFKCDNCKKYFSCSSSLSRHKQKCTLHNFQIENLLERIKILEIEQKKINKVNNELSNKLNKTQGYIYLMQSQVHPTFFKIGRTTDLKDREKSLMKDNTYKTYQLKIIKHYLVNNYYEKEKELHDKFVQFRYCKTNGYNCDTELFIINDKDNFIKNFEEMFKSEI